MTSSPSLPAAVLLDMDGTLVDTEPYWLATEHEVVERHGSTWSHEQGLKLVGQDLRTAARIILDETGLDGEPDDLVAELVAGVVERMRREGTPWRPGAQALLARLGEAGVPCALVTMSYAEVTTAVVEGSPAGTFATVVSGDQVTHGKPHPEPYLTAAGRLGVDVRRCVAIEDSPVGASSALAAGARTIAVPLMVDVAARPGLSRLRSLEHLDLDLLGRILDGEDVDEVVATRA
ncbi:HAD family hydrolase [Georgenia muralis]